MKAKSMISISVVYLAAFMGTGLIGGGEVTGYFVSCGAKGIMGMLLASFLASFCCFSVLIRLKQNKITSYMDYLYAIMPKSIVGVMGFAIFLTLSGIVWDAASVFANVLEDMIGIAPWIGSLMALLFCFLIWIEPRYFIPVCILFLGLMVLGILAGGTMVVFLRETGITETAAAHPYTVRTSIKFILFSIAYVSGSIILPTVILVSLQNRKLAEKTVLLISLVCAMILMMIFTILFLVIHIYYGKIGLCESPMITIMGRIGIKAKAMYEMILAVSALSAAAISGHGLLFCFFPKNDLKRVGMSLLLCFCGIVFSHFSVVYYRRYLLIIYGVCGLYLLVCIVADGITLIISRFFQKQPKKDKKHSIQKNFW